MQDIFPETQPTTVDMHNHYTAMRISQSLAIYYTLTVVTTTSYTSHSALLMLRTVQIFYNVNMKSNH